MERSFLDLVRELDGEYRCPEDHQGRPIGPLVGLESRYATDRNSQSSNRYVTKVYYNFAWVEQHHPRAYRELCRLVAAKLAPALEVQPDDYILSIPRGGLLLGFMVAGVVGCRFAAAEKHFFQSPAETIGEKLPEPKVGLKYKLVLNRHQLPPNARVIIADDVVNNFTVVIGLLQQIINFATPIGIICMVNRSSQTHFICPGFPTLTIVPLIHQPTEQFRQDDPAVAAAVREHQVFWKPRQEWPRLLEVMNQNR